MINSTSTPNFQDLVDSVVEPLPDEPIKNDGTMKKIIAVGIIILGIVAYALIR